MGVDHTQTDPHKETKKKNHIRKINKVNCICNWKQLWNVTVSKFQLKTAVQEFNKYDIFKLKSEDKNCHFGYRYTYHTLLQPSILPTMFCFKETANVEELV